MAVLDIGTIFGRGTVAFDTKLGQPLGLRSLAGRALEPCKNRVGRPFAAPVPAQQSAAVAQL